MSDAILDPTSCSFMTELFAQVCQNNTVTWPTDMRGYASVPDQSQLTNLCDVIKKEGLKELESNTASETVCVILAVLYFTPWSKVKCVLSSYWSTSRSVDDICQAGQKKTKIFWLVFFLSGHREAFAGSLHEIKPAVVCLTAILVLDAVLKNTFILWLFINWCLCVHCLNDLTSYFVFWILVALIFGFSVFVRTLLVYFEMCCWSKCKKSWLLLKKRWIIHKSLNTTIPMILSCCWCGEEAGQRLNTSLWLLNSSKNWPRIRSLAENLLLNHICCYQLWPQGSPNPPKVFSNFVHHRHY